MTRRIPIYSIVPANGGTNGTISVAATTALPENPTGDWTSVFRGKMYRQKVSPFAMTPFNAPPGVLTDYQLIETTSFDIVDNTSYAGRYTVFSPPVGDASAASTFVAPITTIRVNEAIVDRAVVADLTTGYVTNISTYYLQFAGGHLIVPPGVSLADYPVEIVGRNFSGYGESLNQNVLNLYSNFASATAPTAPLTGALWFDLNVGAMKMYDGTSWGILNAVANAAAAASYRHTQSTSAMTWTIAHGLNLAAPYIANTSFFVNVSGAVKPIIPSDVTFIDANHLSVTFTTGYTGYALVKT
jgi:hypothetical protein